VDLCIMSPKCSIIVIVNESWVILFVFHVFLIHIFLLFTCSVLFTGLTFLRQEVLAIEYIKDGNVGR
jgi:hypothetical protein